MSEINTPTNYHDFRNRFLAAVQKRGLQLHSIQLRGLSPQGRPIFTDIAHSVFNPRLPTLIHISGCHGIEGYLGSAIQSTVLEMEEFPTFWLNKVNLVFIHALNAYGMSWYRRVNAHNVDLNRNYFKEGSERPLNSDFDLFAPLFEKFPTLKRWKIWKQVLFAILKFRLRKSAGVIAKGQYHLPESLFYGGTANENEILEPLRFLEKNLSSAPALYVIDVHSGLGKWGTENLILDSLHEGHEVDFWEKSLAGNLINPVEDPRFYPADGPLAGAFRDFFPKTKVHYILEEFGTRSFFAVFKALIKEHKSFLKLKLDRLRAFSMIATFFPYEKSWREQSSEIGRQSYLKVLEYLSKNS